MMDRKLNISIKQKMMIAFFSLNLITLVTMFIFSQYYFSGAIKTETFQFSRQTSDRLNNHMDLYFRYLAQSTYSFFRTPEVQQFLRQKSANSQELIQLDKLMGMIMSNYFPEIAGMFLLSEEKNLVTSIGISTSSVFMKEPWYTQKLTDKLEVLPTHKVQYQNSLNQFVVSLVLPVHDIDTIKVIGHFIVDIRLNEIEKAFKGAHLGKNGFFVILSEDGSIIYDTSKSMLGQPISQTRMKDLDLNYTKGTEIQYWKDEQWLVTVIPSSVQGWRILSAVPVAEVNRGLQTAKFVVLVVLVSMIIGTLVLVPMLTNLFFRPVSELVRSMRKVADGDFRSRVRIPGSKDEFWLLTQSFNQMVEQLENMINTVYDLQIKNMQTELEQREAMIRALQNQTNPHLLYNTLEIIRSIAYLDKNQKIETISRNLGEIYRYNARFSTDEVLLTEEIAHVFQYLEIIQIRFPVFFRSEIYVNEKYLNCKCIKLILQPIVENAVKYAVEPQEGDATVIISAYNEGDMLYIEVADNGPGIEERRLSEINAMLEQIADGSRYEVGNSLGIANVHARLVLKYGTEFGLHIASFPGKGTVVSIKIPFRRIG